MEELESRDCDRKDRYQPEDRGRFDPAGQLHDEPNECEQQANACSPLPDQLLGIDPQRTQNLAHTLASLEAFGTRISKRLEAR